MKHIVHEVTLKINFGIKSWKLVQQKVILNIFSLHANVVLESNLRLMKYLLTTNPTTLPPSPFWLGGDGVVRLLGKFI